MGVLMDLPKYNTGGDEIEVITKTITYKRSDQFSIYGFGDIHCGIKHCAEDKARAQVKLMAADPEHNFIVGMGDDAECITPHDPRWDYGVIADWIPRNKVDDLPKMEEDWVYELERPIAGQFLTKLTGNHEAELRKHCHYDLHGHLCERLKVQSGGYMCFLRLIFKRKGSTESHMYTMLATHGNGCAVTKGAKMNRLQALMGSFDADMYFHGHVHDIITDTKAYLTLNDAGRIKQREKVGAMTGSWFTTYTQGEGASYGEVKNYPPSVLGCPRFVITPDEGRLQVMDS